MNPRFPTPQQMRRWLCLMLVATPVAAQQVADPTFHPPIENPAYPAGTGPVVLIDEAHDNFHTSTGRYMPFAALLRRDGFIVTASVAGLTVETLETARMLVMANAVTPLTSDEKAAVQGWVTGGGSLFLIADHAPFDAAAADLGEEFGIRFSGRTARDPNDGSGRLVFRRADATLMDHPITKDITEVATFSGTSFQLSAGGQPLLVFGPRVYSFRAQNDPSPVSIEGHLQGAVVPFGRGRVAVFGEAAMFSAQITGPDRHPMGMNAPIARHNARFLLNVMHWLAQ